MVSKHPSAASVEILEARIAPAAVAAISLADLNGKNGFKLATGESGDLAGRAVSAAGDVNGDGFCDFLVGADGAAEGGFARGAVYVVFGKAGGFDANMVLSELNGSNGFKLSGATNSTQAGSSVSAAGDVNGDGFDDILVGAFAADEGGTNRGAAYVIFGKASGFGASVALSSLNGSNGFKLSGVADNDYAGVAVSTAGDVNGDGFDDLLIGANVADEGGTDRGATYVVFGKANGYGSILALSGLNGSNGFKISGIADNDFAGGAVSPAGDVNGDGFDDILVGAAGADGGGFDRGAAYVIFGKAGGFGASMALSTLNGSNGFRLSGIANSDYTGIAVSSAGDVNGDGFGDLLVGANLANEGGSYRGAAYVVFGKASGFSTNEALSSLDGSNGFKLSGAANDDYTGSSVSGAGDVNGDGFDDLLVSAYRAKEGGSVRGAAYVIFGKAGGFGASVALSSLNGSNGFKISGVTNADQAGISLSTAGDVNGDGFDDVLVGTYGVGAYVAFGFGTADVSVAANGKSATFTDWDGDLVTIKTTKGSLDSTQFKLSSPNPLTGGSHLVYADFTTAGTGNEFIGANLTFTAKRGPEGGDGLVNVGTLDGRGVALGKVSVDGDLQQLDATSVAGLTVYSLGQFADADVHGAPLTSEIGGKLGALTVKTDASHVTLAAQTFGAIKALNLDSVSILASGTVNPAKIANALAIQSLTVSGSVHNSHILAGYDATGTPMNADVQIGKVLVKGQWVASDLAAGVRAGNDGIFATGDANETLVPGGNSIVAKIASITISGTAIGSAENLRDGFGFAAEEIGALRIGKAKVPLQKGAHNDTDAQILALTGDLRVVETA